MFVIMSIFVFLFVLPLGLVLVFVFLVVPLLATALNSWRLAAFVSAVVTALDS